MRLGTDIVSRIETEDGNIPAGPSKALTKPSPTGSALTPMTIAIVLVTSLAACVIGLVIVTITSALSETRLRTISEKRS